MGSAGTPDFNTMNPSDKQVTELQKVLLTCEIEK